MVVENRHRRALEIREAVINDVRQYIGAMKVFDDIATAKTLRTFLIAETIAITASSFFLLPTSIGLLLYYFGGDEAEIEFKTPERTRRLKLEIFRGTPPTAPSGQGSYCRNFHPFKAETQR